MCATCVSTSGESNPNWRGGNTYHKSGYVMTYAPDHPRVRQRKGSRYVFEHILVMEKHLGRHLLSGENVHHKNGVKDDNRPENLELWVTGQPSGVRVEDAVAWAKEILERYG